MESLWKRNTQINRSGPENGDLMIIYKAGTVSAVRHHTALVYRVYAVSEAHAKIKDNSIPNFPGPDAAKKRARAARSNRSIDLVKHSNCAISTDAQGSWPIDGGVAVDSNLPSPITSAQSQHHLSLSHQKLRR